MKIRSVFRPIVFRYILLGVGFGLLLPVLGSLFQILLIGQQFNLTSILQVQRDHPLLWIIDTAPVVLGVLFGLIGVRQNILTKMKDDLEDTVKQRTAELLVANKQLNQELELLHQVEEVVSRGKKEWENTFDAVADLIFVVDSGGNITRCNKAVIIKLNSTYQALIGCSFLEVLCENSQSAPLDLHIGEMEIPRLGAWYDVLIEKMDLEGPSRTVYVFHNITKRKLIENDIALQKKSSS
jgi:PAS domain-containing protein